MAVANMVAYYDISTITAVNGFVVQALHGTTQTIFLKRFCSKIFKIPTGLLILGSDGTEADQLTHNPKI
jgi:hypothetical protein